MSDEPSRPAEVPAPPPAPAGIFEHYCEHPGCKEWGGWGFGSKHRGHHYFCYGHCGDGEQFL